MCNNGKYYDLGGNLELFLKFTAGLVLAFCIMSIGYSFYLYGSKVFLSVRATFSKLKNVKINLNSPITAIKKIKKPDRRQVSTFVFSLFTLNSSQKQRFVFYALPISVILSVPLNFIQFNKFTIWAGFVCIFITLLGIAKYLGRNFEGYWLDKIHSYFLKICIFTVYSLGFLGGYLEKPDNDMLFIISLVTTIIFSVYILKSIMDGFHNIEFCVANFLLIYFFDLIVIGLYFGFFYLHNNEIFKLYSNIKQYDSYSLFNILSIGRTGLSGLYTISTSDISIDSLKGFVPLSEYMFGAVFNVGIIGFFISYMASKISQSANKDDKVVKT